MSGTARREWVQRVLEVPLPAMAAAGGHETGTAPGTPTATPTAAPHHAEAHHPAHTAPQGTPATRDAFLAQEGMFKELMATLPRDDPRAVAILQDLKPVVAAKNSGQADVATEGLTALVRRGQELKAAMTQEKHAVQQRLDGMHIPASLPADAAKQAPALRQTIVKALTPELLSGPALEKVKGELTSLEGVLAKAQAEVAQSRDELKKKLDPVTLSPWLPTDQVEPLKALRQKVVTELAVEPPTFDGVAGAQKDFDALVAGISQAQAAVHKKKQETLHTIEGMTTPAYMPPATVGELDTLRNQAQQAMAPDLPAPAQFDAATNAINQFNAKVHGESDKITQRKKPLSDALPGLVTPAWAAADAVKAMDGFRATVTAALADEFPTADKLLAAEQAVAALRKALQDETARVTKQKETLTQKLRALADPPGADTEDLRNMAAERQKATDALAEAMPVPDNMKKAEDAIGALDGLIKQAKQVSGVAGKYGVTSDVTAQTKGAFQQFRRVLGNVEVNDKLIADAKKTAEDQAAALLAKQQAYAAATKMPEGNPQQKRAKQAAVAQTTKDYFDARDAKNTGDAYLKAALGQKNLTDALAGGPLSGNSDQKFKPETAATLIKGFSENPTLAKAATDAATTAKFPDAIAAGWPTVRDATANQFKSPEGRTSGAAFADGYGANLLKNAGNSGPGYLDRLPDYLASGDLYKPSEFGATPGTFTELEGQRARVVAGKLMKDDGTIDVDSPEAKKIVGQLLYGSDSMNNQTPDLNAHVLKTLEQLKDPRATAMMKGVTAAPTNPGAQGLVRSAMGKGGADPIDAKDTRQAIMKSMLTPVSQGSVGSCFATGPVRKLRETQPMDAMKAYTEIATKGTFKPVGATNAVPAVTNLPPNEDPLSRSLEFSLASSTAVEASSRENDSFAGAMKPGIDQFRPMAGGGLLAWPRKKAAVTAAISGAFTLVYDPTADVGNSADGSSSKGHYVLTLKAGDKAITTQAAFSDAIADIAIGSFGASGDEANQIKALTKTPAFITAVCPGKYKPWDLASGGFGDQATKSLFGNGLTVKPVMTASDGSVPEGERAATLMKDMMSQFRGKGDQMIAINTWGIHSFNALPNDPSLEPLKGRDNAETAEKVQKNLVDKGQSLKNTDLTAERAQFLFDQELNAAIKAEKNPDWVQLLQDGVKAHRPTSSLKPAALEREVQAALKPYQDAQSTKEADDWKHGEEGATPPKPVTPAKLQEKLDALKKQKATWSGNGMKSNLMRDMAVPEFVIADTNWGSGQSHTFFVIAPDPVTGEPAMWQKTDPPGTLAPMEKKWLDTQWEAVD